MPIGYPAVYPVYLAKRQGPFATLGLAEDTWGLNEHVLDDEHFLQQCLDIDAEREAMFFDGLDKVPQGLCVCVFDGSDRMQHMFWRYLDPSIRPGRPRCRPRCARPIEDMYQRMDDLVGQTMAKCHGDDTLLHGDFRPRLQRLPPRRRPEPLAGRERLPGRRRRRRRRGAPGRRRLVADAGLRHRTDRDLHQPVKASSSKASSRRARRPSSCARKSPGGWPRWSIRQTARTADQARLPGGRRPIADPTRSTPPT